MPHAFRKLLLVVGALVIAAGVTYFPWMLLDKVPASASNLYGMTAVFWAPTALILGIVMGYIFASKFWPRES